MKHPKMKPGTTEMVSVAWILQNATGSVDGFNSQHQHFDGHMVYTVDYVKMLKAKARDYNFGNLVAAIFKNGFKVPIVLINNFTDSYYLPDPEAGYVVHGNGHHRMCAAILLCLDEIPVYWSDDSDEYMCSYASDTSDVGSHPDWDDIEDLMRECVF